MAPLCLWGFSAEPSPGPSSDNPGGGRDRPSVQVRVRGRRPARPPSPRSTPGRADCVSGLMAFLKRPFLGEVTGLGSGEVGPLQPVSGSRKEPGSRCRGPRPELCPAPPPLCCPHGEARLPCGSTGQDRAALPLSKSSPSVGVRPATGGGKTRPCSLVGEPRDRAGPAPDRW